MPDGLVSVDEFLARVLADLRPAAPVAAPLLDALGLVCAEDVTAPLSLPRFDNSAMDGYAVRREDVATATPDAPVELPVVGQIGAGQAGPSRILAGEVAKIMTGAPVPEGADAVVPYEWTDRGASTVRVSQAPAPGQHIRPAGGDVTEGDHLISAGTRLGPRHLGLLASVGRPTVSVRPRPRVAVLSTGSELRDPGEELGPDSIYDGNSYLLAASARRFGATDVRVGTVPDDEDAFLALLHETAATADVIVTSGGVSQGDFDIVKSALRSLGTVWFGGVAMQPGKPQGFGVVGERRVPIFTLPGNPVSSYISFELFVRPALRTLMGLAPAVEPMTTATLDGSVSSLSGKRQFLRGRYARGADGATVTVRPIGGTGSHLVGDLAASNALIVVPEELTALESGTQVQVVLLDRGAHE
ncbi:gephyrin-like molybdotransferase Glp [Nocardioides sp. cx-173]|uniref:molybdotransferase-like divisome protein Glp n=1 Tax=Nocardioides sp. cx-173 TaxID=2898796 RepID=UPI001E412245|nr:gephyrin-like molybdotransferase Glp [Nocardioides sp. cx-173]MCD4527357.1 molybdopterin molybdotransferase MoeA [Nocardioides sp. cx-173]UGB42402.1 molybdopterin molybdotransferase MoeA [Nocardioides sp. cx-173]